MVYPPARGRVLRGQQHSLRDPVVHIGDVTQKLSRLWIAHKFRLNAGVIGTISPVLHR
jgi:hypothetical protein